MVLTSKKGRERACFGTTICQPDISHALSLCYAKTALQHENSLSFGSPEGEFLEEDLDADHSWGR